MALITQEQRKSLNIIVPFAIGGWVFYSAYVKKGKTDWKNAGLMALIVFACCYIVTTQTTKIFAPEEQQTA
jgi:hypothetical protein